MWQHCDEQNSTTDWLDKTSSTWIWTLFSTQGLTLSIWFTCPSGMWFWKLTCPAKIFTCPGNICTSPVRLMYTDGKISTCPDWKITCPVGLVTTKVYVPWDKNCMPQACGHALMSSPAKAKYHICTIITKWSEGSKSSITSCLFFSFSIHSYLALQSCSQHRLVCSCNMLTKTGWIFP